MTIEKAMQMLQDSEARQIKWVAEMKAMWAEQDAKIEALAAKVEKLVAERQPERDRYAAQDMLNAGK